MFQTFEKKALDGLLGILPLCFRAMQIIQGERVTPIELKPENRRSFLLGNAQCFTQPGNLVRHAVYFLHDVWKQLMTTSSLLSKYR